MGLFAICFSPLVECHLNLFTCIFLGCLCVLFMRNLYISGLVFYHVCDLNIIPPGPKLIFFICCSCLSRAEILHLVSSFTSFILWMVPLVSHTDCLVQLRIRDLLLHVLLELLES